MDKISEPAIKAASAVAASDNLILILGKWADGEDNAQALPSASSFVSNPEEAWQTVQKYRLADRTLPLMRNQRIVNNLISVRPRQWMTIISSNVHGDFRDLDPLTSEVQYLGTMHRLQCSVPCLDDIWDNDGSELPKCPRCGVVARPNCLLQNDSRWVDSRIAIQWRRLYRDLLDRREWQSNVVILEVLVETKNTLLKQAAEMITWFSGGQLIRIGVDSLNPPNPSTIQVPTSGIEELEAVSLQIVRTSQHLPGA